MSHPEFWNVITFYKNGLRRSPEAIFVTKEHPWKFGMAHVFVGFLPDSGISTIPSGVSYCMQNTFFR